MAFKGRGLADLKIQDRGRIIEVRPATPDMNGNGGGALVTVDGVTFTRRLEKYPGTPSKAMLAANNLDLRTLKNKPYPASATDRFTKSPPDTASRLTADGQPANLAGPSSMEMAQRRGEWPDKEEQMANAIAEARFRDPEGTTRAIAIARGMKPEEADALAKRAAAPGTLEHIAGILNAPAPTQPRQSDARKGAA